MRHAETVFSPNNPDLKIAWVEPDLDDFLSGREMEDAPDRCTRSFLNHTVPDEETARQLGLVTLGQIAALLAGRGAETHHLPKQGREINVFLIDDGARAIVAWQTRGGWELSLATPGDPILLTSDLRIIS